MTGVQTSALPISDRIELLVSDIDVQVWTDFIIAAHCDPETARNRLKALGLTIGSDTRYALIIIDDVTLKKNLDEWIKNKNLATINDLLAAFFKTDSLYQRTISQKDTQLTYLMCTTWTTGEISAVLQTLHDLCQSNYSISLAVYWGVSEIGRASCREKV